MDHSRHASLFNCRDLSITLVGAGGIGAITAVTLAKMGAGYLTLYDNDEISPENMATQLHKLADLGRAKVFAVQNLIEEFSDDTQVLPLMERVVGSSNLQDQIIISAVDSISARKAIWAAAKGNSQWYLDARMAAEEFHLYCVDQSKDVSWYEQILGPEDDSLIADAPCTSKATFFCAALAAGIIGRTVRMIASNMTPPRIYIQHLLTDSLISIQ